MTKIRNPRRLIAATALAAGTLLAGTATAQAVSAWFHATGVATAYDKALAHDIAVREAVRAMETDCSAQLASQSEIKATYDQNPTTGEWRATVEVRGLCNNDTGALP